MSSESEPPHILVEGGPVHRRVNHVLALLIGVVIGGGLGIGATAILALHATHEVKHARERALRDACETENQHHWIVAQDFKIILARTPKPAVPLTHRERVLRDKNIALFIDAIAEYHPDCHRYVRERL